MNLKTVPPLFRPVVIALLVIIIAEVYDQKSAYADPSLPIVVDHGTISIEVYPQKHQLIVRKQGQKIKTYTVAVGNPATPTPIGEYQVVYKGKDWGPSFGPRWLGLKRSLGDLRHTRHKQTIFHRQA